MSGIYLDADYVVPAVNDSTQAGANVTLLQAALNNGGLIWLRGSGVVWINAPLVIGSNTRLVVPPAMTIRTVSGTNNNVLQSAAYTRSWNSATLAWLAGTVATLTLTAHGRSVGDPVCVQGTVGTTDSAYSGTFYVVSVIDANNVTITLRRVPAAAPSGTIQAKAADYNIAIQGGVWDYYYTGGNNGASAGSNQHAIILAGVAKLELVSVVGTNTAKYIICLAGVRDFVIREFHAFATNSDGIKIYGPAFDGTVTDAQGIVGDDFISFQPYEASDFPQYNFWGGGDTIGLEASTVNSNTVAASVAVYSKVAGFVVDGISINKVSNTNRNNPAISVTTLSGCRIQSAKLTEVYANNGYGLALANAGTIDSLAIDGIRMDRATTDTTVPPINLAGAGTTHKLSIKNFIAYANAAAYLAEVTTTIDLMEIDDSYFEGIGGAYGTAVAMVSGTITSLSFRNVRMNSAFRLVDHVGGTVSNVSGDSISGTASQLFNMTAACRISVSNLNLVSTTVARLNAAGITFTMASDGRGTLSGGGWLTKVSGTEVVNLFGSDIQVDVTTVARVNGGCCYNTNASAGTFVVAGVVDCLGTSTGSWHLRGTPTLVY